MRPDRVLLDRRAIVSIGGTFLLMGLVVGAHGPLLEHLTRRFAVRLPVAGATISVHFAGALVGVLVAMRAMQETAARSTVIVAPALARLGCLAVSVAPTLPAFPCAGVLLGL